MSNMSGGKKPKAKGLFSLSEEAVAATWSSLANTFPGMLPSMQPAKVPIKSRASLNKREVRFRKL